MERMKREGLLPSKNTYFYGFECLGKLMNKNGSQLPPSSHPQSISKNKALNRITPKSVIPMEKIGHEAKNLIDAAEKELSFLNLLFLIVKSLAFYGVLDTALTLGSEGIDVVEEFMYLLSCVSAGGRVNDETSSRIVKARAAYTNVWRLCDGSLAVKGQIYNASGHDLTQGLLGLSLEEGSLRNILTALLYVRPNINPNLNYFIHYSSSNISTHTKRIKEISHPAQKHLDSVKHERKNPYAGIFTDFGDISKAFKNQMYVEQMTEVTVSPVLSPFGQSETTSLSPELKKNLGIDMLIVDSALQYTSSSIACLQLGRRVERACTVYRQEKIGYFKQLEKMYMTYATLFNEHEMKFSNFRHMWLYALQSRIDQGPNTQHNWTSWPPTILFMIGEVLYSLIYEHLRFDLNGPLRVRHEFSKSNEKTSSNIRRKDTPAIFEVLAEFPTEVTNEIKVHPTLINWYRDADYPPLSFHPCALPMLCPPVPWINLDDAGYLISRNYATRLIRCTSVSSTNPTYLDDLDFDCNQIPSILDALNCLASCPWKINNTVC
ncbi:unnamed protein product [Schistosoma mattheei]|uniref:DNA-directed RNA polymerase N-terminal domain-containing protein n=1 Tax=Schistosoma mattheei TaxID=31246 RepID=A0A3P8FSZ5_9TREM|nr:unnamed protein product [Schistosoma mattheei]